MANVVPSLVETNVAKSSTLSMAFDVVNFNEEFHAPVEAMGDDTRTKN